MGKVNEGREFRTRVPSGYYDFRQLFELDEPIVHPYRLEYRIHEDNVDEFKIYLNLLLVPVLGISNYRTHTTKHSGGTNFHISLSANEVDMRLLQNLLERLRRGMEDYRLGNLE